VRYDETSKHEKVLAVVVSLIAVARAVVPRCQNPRGKGTNMSKNVSNEEIVRRFVDAKAIDFKAIGNLVGDMGPDLAASNIGHRIVLIGRPFIVACIMPPAEAADLVGELRNINLAGTLTKE
jgi:hypothetical protein